MNPPKVFISHASEDKDRFVLAFAKRLRDNGIDAWVDKWEMLPGDSLVDKIFEVGLKEASAVMIILSNSSINKPWVKEEINTAFVKRINTKCKLIPLLIDNCEVPACLQTTLWEKITNLSSYDEAYKRIELAILGKTDKPSIGSTPKYAAEIIEKVNDLTDIDSLIFKITCEQAIELRQPFIMAYGIIAQGMELDLSQEIIIESLEVLENNYFLEITKMLSPEHNSIKVLLHAFQTYYQYYNTDYDSQINLVGSLIVNNGILNNQEIANTANIDLFIVDHILELLDYKGYIKNLRFLGGNSEISNVSVELKRHYRK
jgi:hypothetical protein